MWIQVVETLEKMTRKVLAGARILDTEEYEMRRVQNGKDLLLRETTPTMSKNLTKFLLVAAIQKPKEVSY